jgi:hypothetical protein
MAVEAKQLAGVLNMDDPYEDLPLIHHVNARNVTFRGNGANMRVQNIRGTTLIPNANLPPFSTNRTIGALYDQVKGRLFVWNWNSENKHGIYIYTPSANTIVPLIINTVSTNGDALFLNLNFPCIHHGIIYGDNVQGDILYYLDGNGKPCKINIDRQLAGGYGTVRRSYLEVAKEPFDIPPQVAYEDDPTVTVNTLRKKLFVFKARPWFDDKEKATWSQHSECPLPLNPFDTSIDSDPTKNADIAIVIQTGAPNVKKIEIAAAVSLGNVYSDFFSIVTLDKAALGIPDDDIYLFRFYNDKQYNYVETNVNPLQNESILLFDLVPLWAAAMEILNGNTLIYANVTEGYPNITNFSNGTFTTNVSSAGENSNRTNTFFLFTVAQFGKTSNGTGNTHIIVAGHIGTGDQFFTVFNSVTVSYIAIAGDTATSVINGLMANAISNGFTIISNDANNLYIFKANTILIRFNATQSTGLNINNTSWDAYDWNSRYSFGLVYYDEKGRTPGVQTNPKMSIQTIPYGESGVHIQTPILTASIYHRPPLWATSYSLVRTKNLSKSTLVEWISDRTFKDTATSSGAPLYAYISIETLNTFVADNPGSPLTYQFSAGDRITFMKRFIGTVGFVLPSNKDFEVQGQVLNPIINGVQETGQFVKIFLPTTDLIFDFGSSSTTNYNNYFIELYSPAQPVANGLDAYYEFSERFAIIDAGTGTQYHQGQTQNQTADLVTPAIIPTNKGDNYYKLRTINTGVKIVYQIEGGYGPDSNAGQITLGCAVQSQSYNDPNIVTGNSPYNNLIGFDYHTNTVRQILSVTSGNYIFRITGTIVVTWIDNRPGDSYKFSLQDNTGAETPLVPVFDNSVAGTHSFNVDAVFNLSAGQRIFILGLSIPNVDHTRSFTTTQLTITAQQAYAQGVIDLNFSDYYKSSVNSNGRALIVDPNANTVTYPTLLRWGQSYLVDTNINQSNRFYTTDFDTIDRAKGAIRKLKVRDRILRGWQDRYCFQMGIYAKFIQDSGGQNTLTTTDSIITSNNVQYYEGEYGVGNHPESIVHGKIQDYFADYIRGALLRLSGDGIIDLTKLYKGQYSIKSLLTQYNNPWTNPADGSNSRIMGTYDYFNEEYIPVLQGGIIGGNTLAPNTLSFNEPRNAFTSFYDYHPEWISNYEDQVVSFVDGNLYIHNSATYSNFYGTQYDSTITLVFNKESAIKKTFESIRYQANQYWIAKSLGDVLSSQPNPQTGLPQISKFFQQDFTIEEGVYFNSLLRDANSMQDPIAALWEGDFLKGWYLLVKLSYSDGQFAWIYAPTIGYEISQRNFK